MIISLVVSSSSVRVTVRDRPGVMALRISIIQVVHHNELGAPICTQYSQPRMNLAWQWYYRATVTVVAQSDSPRRPVTGGRRARSVTVATASGAQGRQGLAAATPSQLSLSLPGAEPLWPASGPGQPGRLRHWPGRAGETRRAGPGSRRPGSRDLPGWRLVTGAR
jgi:hypothetical protein